MAEDWAIDVRRYAPDADDAVIKGIVRYCGIALTKRDSSLVSFTDPKETARVRDGYCRKKLGLTDPDAIIDAAIMKVGERMSGDTTRNRVTVYYLLAEAFDKLGVFAAKPAKAAAETPAKSPAKTPAKTSTKAKKTTVPAASLAAATAVGAAAPLAAPVAAASPPPPTRTTPMTAKAAPQTAEPARRSAAAAALPGNGDNGGFLGFAGAAAGGLAVLVFGTMLLGNYIGSRGDAPPPTPAPVAAVPTPAPAPVAPAIPDGAGVVGETVDGKPKVSVYFDTGKADITPDFAVAAAPIKAWIDANPGDRLAVSGFNDATGNATQNAELSKNRAEAVAAALEDAGVPADRIDLVKPADTTATDADMAQARRVEIVVTEGG